MVASMGNAAGVSLLAFALSVAAHGGVYFYEIDGVTHEGFHPYDTPVGQSSIQRVWFTHDPILDVSLPIIACNDNGNPNEGQLTANATAGSKINFSYNKDWDHESGPILAYLSKCPGDSCDEVNVNELDWFKIGEAGLLSGTLESGLWANKQMMDDGWKWSVNIPASIANGHYLLRTEQIALHSQPAQNYPQCAQLKISGGQGVEVPAEYLVKFPGGYKQSDPGLTIDIWSGKAMQTTEYIIPGPKVYTGEGAAPVPVPEPSQTSSTESVPQPTSQPTSSTPEPSSQPIESTPEPEPTPEPTETPKPQPPTSTEHAPGPVATLWGQCGGKKWRGTTTCPEGTVCQGVNVWFSQCAPDDTVGQDGSLWGQCGGDNYKGKRTCPTIATCVKVNKWYSECQPN